MTEPTLVLLPGLDGTGLLFEKFRAALPSDLPVRTIAYPADQRLSIEEYAAFVFDALPPGPLMLLAESFSGLVAVALLSNYSVEVDKVIFVASPQGMTRLSLLKTFFPLMASSLRWIPADVMRFFCLGRGATPSDVDRLKRVLWQVDPAIITHRLRLITLPSHMPRQPIKVPAVYIQATDDRLVPPSAANFYRHCFRDFTLVSRNGPHFLLQASPTACANLIADLAAKKHES